MTSTTVTNGAGAASVPVGAPDRGRTISWWGVMAVIATEATIFASLLGAYFFVRATSPAWPQGGIDAPELRRTGVFTVVLLSSSIPLFFAESALERGRDRRLRGLLLVNVLLGAAFLVNQVLEYRDLDFGLRDNAYGSLFYMITGLHGLHVLVGLCLCVVLQIKVWTGRQTKAHHALLVVFVLYWHFVDVVWIFVFTSLYLSVSWR